MKATIEHCGKEFEIDFEKPIDISIPMKATPQNMKAWYLNPMSIEPVRTDGFIGNVKE